MTKLGIFGTSGFAREVGDIADALGYEPIYLAADASELAVWAFDQPAILESELETLGSIPFAIGIGENRIRERVATRYRDRLSFPSLIHPTSSFGRGQRAKIEAQSGVIVCAGVRFTNNIEVGAFCVFNLNATVGHDCVFEGRPVRPSRVMSGWPRAAGSGPVPPSTKAPTPRNSRSARTPPSAPAQSLSNPPMPRRFTSAFLPSESNENLDHCRSRRQP